MPCTCWTTAQATTCCPDRALLSLLATWTLGGLNDQEVIELVRRGSSPEWLDARRPEPLRDDIAAVELAVPAAG